MEVLRRSDLEGNTVLHLAASTNQPKVMEIIVKHVDVKDKNLEGLTAVDIAKELGPQENGEALRILHKKKAKRGSSIINNRPKYSSLAQYFSSPVNIFEKISKLDAYLDMGLPGDMRNAVLVVAVLMATAIYQAGLEPPEGLSIVDFRKFTTLNTFTFATSLAVIILVLPGRLYNLPLYISLLAFMIGYVVAVDILPLPRSLSGTPMRTSTYANSIKFGSFTFVCVIAYVKIFLMIYNVWTSRFSAGNRHLKFYEIRTLLFQSKHGHTNSDGAKV